MKILCQITLRINYFISRSAKNAKQGMLSYLGDENKTMTTAAEWKKIQDKETAEEPPRKCKACGSEDLSISNEGYEYEGGEIIEAVQTCNDCGNVER